MRFLVPILFLTACAAAPRSVPTTTPLPPCEAVINALCMKGEICGIQRHEVCFAGAPQVCNEIEGITAEEATVCSQALLTMPCDTPTLPPACLHIGTPRKAPSREGLSL